jgi:PAS domain S-box-containing protein
MTNIIIIIILLAALAITAGLLIFVVFKVMLRKQPSPGSGEFLAKVLDGLPVPVLEIDSEHQVIQWNASLESLSGVKKQAVLGTDGQWRAFYSERRPVLADLIADGASEQEIALRYKGGAKRSQLIEGAWEAEDFFPSMGKDGRWYHYTASPIREGGRIIGAVEILEDVTERHIAEQNLRYYVGQVTRVQEEERKHLARELHDTTAGSRTSTGA